MKTRTFKKIKDVIWGLLLILAAVLLILRSTDVALPFINGISMVKLVGAVVVIAFIISRLLDRKLSLILQALTVLYGIFLEEIAQLAGTEESALPSFWIVFLCSIIIEIGIKLIFKQKNDFSFGDDDIHFFSSDDDDDDDDEDDGDDTLKGSTVSFNGHKVGEISRYLDCRDFKCAELGHMVGQISIYFDNTDAYKSGGELRFNKIVGEACIYVPAEWKIRVYRNTSLGDINVESSDKEGDKILYIKANKTVGEINVYRR